MKQILYIGMNPHTLDFSEPGFEPGLTAEKVEQSINAELVNLKNQGFDTNMHFIDTGIGDLDSLVSRLRQEQFHGILIGAGIRVPRSNFILFEKIINTIHVHATGAKILFNTNPGDSYTAIKRWL